MTKFFAILRSRHCNCPFIQNCVIYLLNFELRIVNWLSSQIFKLLILLVPGDDKTVMRSQIAQIRIHELLGDTSVIKPLVKNIFNFAVFAFTCFIEIPSIEFLRQLHGCNFRRLWLLKCKVYVTHVSPLVYKVLLRPFLPELIDL